MLIKRTVSVFMVIAMCALIFSGCGKNSDNKVTYNAKSAIKTLDSQIIAENDKLKFSWDNETKGIYLENKATGKVWSNVSETGNVSTLGLYLQDMQKFKEKYVSGNSVIKKNRLSVEKIKDGLKLTYNFDSVKISVPLNLVLREDSLSLSINGKEIIEDNSKYRLVTAAPMTSFTSVKKEEENSYIFTSQGKGALIEINDNADGERRGNTGTENVSSLSYVSNMNDADQSGLRCYGVKANTDSIFCIAEENGGAINFRVSAGDTKSKFSNIYPSFELVDTDTTTGKATNAGEVRLLSDRTESVISVGFYPLSGEEADFNGMAKCYRRYLEKSGLISNQKRDFSSPIAVTALGGVMSTESIFGVPTQTLKTATTFKEAQNIFNNIQKETGVKPVVRLKGFGETGLNYGKVAGGFKFASDFGSDNDRQALEKYCADKKMQLYTDFDLVRYSKSGAGFSYINDSAKTATLHAAEFNPVNPPLRDYNKDIAYRLLSRTKLSKAVDKLINMCNKLNISGVCLTFLGSKSYSDLTDIKYAVTGNMAADTTSLVKKIKKNGTAVSGSASTYFAAGLIDTVFDAPLEDYGHYNFSKELPFYQLVYAGITPLYSSPINECVNPQERIMQAASSGTGLGFSVLKNFENDYMETNIAKLYSCTYNYSMDLIKSSLNKYSKIYDKIAGQKIDKYEFLDDNVTKTTFENGVTVYANHSSFEVDSPVGKLEGFGFMIGSGE